MEIVAPTTQNCLFTTLTQYNETDRVELAECQIVKEQPFINTPHSTFIALESFRLSAGLSKDGLVYKHCLPSWILEGTQRSYDEQANDPDVLEYSTAVPDVRGGHLMPDADNPCEAEINIEFVDPVGNNSSYATLIARSIGSLDRIRRGNEFALQSTNSGYTAGVKILTSALHDADGYGIVGGGAGPHRLHDVLVEVSTSNYVNYAIHASGDQDEDTYAQTVNVTLSIDLVEYDAKVNGGNTSDDIIKMINEGCYLYTSDYWGEVQNDEMIAQVLGPVGCMVAVDDASVSGEANYNHQMDILWVQIRKPNDGAPFTSGDRVDFTDRSGVRHPDSGVIQELSDQWFEITENAETGVEESISLDVVVNFNYQQYSGLSQETRDHLFDQSGSIEQGSQDQEAKKFYLSTIGGRGFGNHLAGTIRIGSKENDPIERHVYYDLAFHPLTTTNLTHTELRRKFDEVTPVYCPNDMFEHYNLRSHDDDVKDSWVLNTSSNGGFEIRLPSGKLSEFRISQDFVDALGLEKRLRYIGTSKESDSSIELAVVELDNMGDWLQHNEDQSLEERMVRHFTPDQLYIDRDYDGGFTTVTQDFNASAQDAVTYYTTLTTSNYVLSNEAHVDAENRYHLKNFTFNNSVRKVCSEQFIDPVPITLQGGAPGWAYNNPPEDSWIPNTQMITLESFSLFDAIRIVCPSGVSFIPMITDVSSGIRVLAEYRIPFIYGTTNGITGEPLVTIDTFYGDIIFNSGASKQYLKVVSSSKVYDCVLRCELVYRNPNHEPPTKQVKIPPTGLFQVKLRWLTTK